MDLLPISASLGAMGSLAGKLDSLLDTELKDEVGEVTARLVRLSKARDPPVTAGVWMKDARELSYDMENCVDVAEPNWIDRMSGFKARVKEANERYDRYRLGNIPMCTDVFPIIDHRLLTVAGDRKTDPGVVGLHDKGGAVDKLRPWLADDGMKELKVVSIVGARGIGKTTLAKQLWRDNELGEFHCRAFVRTAKKPDMRRILRSILAQVRPLQQPDSNEVHELIHGIREHLRDKRYFLIIDDLWATSVWDVARRAFPDGNGSRILTTTESENVALACCSYQLGFKFNMKPLSPSHSDELFTSGMFSSGKKKSHQLDEVTYEIIRRCGGLPLAIISISSVIATQGDANTVQTREQIQNNLPTNTTPDDILKQVLNFCYNCLPSCLQTCLLYLSLYPENYIILKEDIMKQWVAEGFILAPTENEKMKVAGSYFDKLVDMGMIQHIDVDYSDEVRDYSDEVLYYAVRRTVHDLITSKSIEENFVNVIDYSQRTVRFSNKVSRLSLQFGSAAHATTPSRIGLSNVRSLAFIGLESCFPPISEFKLLRFMTLHMWADQPSTCVDLKPISELVLLRSLQVTCNGTVHLPDLIQDPIHLETLEINARVAAIPANIFHLRSWLHLRLGVGTEMPDVTGILKNVTMNPPISVDDSSSPPDSVKTINLLSPISRIPKWVRHLTNLCILKFVVRELQRDGIINLQGLPFLAVLSLRIQRRTREVIGFATGAFAALEYFEFRCGVLRLDFEEGAMPNLQRVKLGFNAHRGEQYGRFLVGIKDMLSIKKIAVLIGSAAGAEETDLVAAESAFKEAIGKHYSKASMKRSDMVEEDFDPPEQPHSIPEQQPSKPSEHPGRRKESPVHIVDVEEHLVRREHPSASSEQPRRQKEESQEEFDLPEQQYSTGEKPPSASTEQPRIPKQDLPEQQSSVGGEHPSVSSEQPPRRIKESEKQIKQDFGTYSQSINRMSPPSAPGNSKNYSRPRQSAAILHKDRQASTTERSMAYLELGLTKAMVEGSLSKVPAAIEVQAKLPQRAQRDMIFIADEFEMMRSSLNVLEECIENELVRTWVKKIHELAYNVEDCMELVAHLDQEKRSLGSRIRRLCVPCAPVRMLALDQAVDEIEQLKARVADASTRIVRYNLISDAASKPVVRQQDRLPGTAFTATKFNMLAEARGATKRNRRCGDLTQLITKMDNYLQVVSVWGADGDYGTTSIIRKTYNHPDTRKNFTYHALVKLTHPFNPRDFVQSLMAQFYANFSQEQGATMGMHVLTKMKSTQEDLFLEFERVVTMERYLIVMEGLSYMVDWDAIRTFLPNTKNGSWIIVSTQQPEIARLCVGHSYRILELEKISEEHSICALFKASQDNGDKHMKPKDSQVDEDKGKKPREYDVNRTSSSYEKIMSPAKEAIEEWIKNHPLVGRESRINELCEYTAKARVNFPPVMSVWGIAGVGKSALVKNLFYNRMLHSVDIYDKYYWVDLSHPFNLRDLYLNLLSDFHSDKDPIEECHRLLEDRCLVVIDDVQSTKEWDLIQAALVSKHSRSVIIVITSEASIARYCTNNEDLMFNVKALEAVAASELFEKLVHKKNLSSRLKVQDMEVQELILKCGGLPKVIAGLLATKKEKNMDTVRSLNHRFMHHLQTDPEYDGLQDLFGWMHSYFRTCLDSLKPCIFYLLIFPRGHIIRRRRLVRRWIAEGYSRDNNIESAEENGEKHFSELVELSIIQQLSSYPSASASSTAFNVDTVRLVLCQVNSFIREYIVSCQMEENLIFELGDKCALTTKRTGRHLVILNNWDRDIIVFKSIDFSRLRSLTVFGKWESFFISESMKMLRVLDLEDASGLNDADLDKMVEWLRRLKFLSLRGHREINHLPRSLDHMRQLQTLDVRDTSVVTLPETITKLHKLQYIRAGITNDPPVSTSWFRRRHRLVGVEGLRGIGKLTALHTLGVVNIGASRAKTIVKELKELTQLRKLGVSGINRKNSKEFGKLVHGAHLESLSVQLDKGNEGSLHDISLPSVNLRSLKLYGLGDKLPESFKEISQLTKVDLEMGTLKRDDVEYLANIPKLSVLRLRVKQTSLHFYAKMSGLEVPTFEKIKILEIGSSSSTLDVTFGSETMKNLEVLKLDYSNGASYRFSGLEHLSKLKQVFLKGTNDETLNALQSEFVKHQNSPVVKLQ